MYLLDWSEGSVILESWTEVVSHPRFNQSTVYERVSKLGWCAL